MIRAVYVFATDGKTGSGKAEDSLIVLRRGEQVIKFGDTVTKAVASSANRACENLDGLFLFSSSATGHRPGKTVPSYPTVFRPRCCYCPDDNDSPSGQRDNNQHRRPDGNSAPARQMLPSKAAPYRKLACRHRLRLLIDANNAGSAAVAGECPD
jgi:hypothetical protein